MNRVLIAEDERAISDLIKMNLSDEGYECFCVYDGKAAADIIESKSFDLVLLDVMLPIIDGFELIEYINVYDIPVIMVTARGDVKDKIKGLRSGAEDYITKPFEIEELLVRVERVLRRYGKSSKSFDVGDIHIDIEGRIVTKGGKVIGLTAKEFDLLVFFVQNKNMALHRSKIYYKVWGEDFMGDSRTVDLHVQRVRKKLALESLLVPVYKIGYRLEV